MVGTFLLFVLLRVAAAAERIFYLHAVSLPPPAMQPPAQPSTRRLQASYLCHAVLLAFLRSGVISHMLLLTACLISMLKDKLQQSVFGAPEKKRFRLEGVKLQIASLGALYSFSFEPWETATPAEQQKMCSEMTPWSHVRTVIFLASCNPAGMFWLWRLALPFSHLHSTCSSKTVSTLVPGLILDYP